MPSHWANAHEGLAVLPRVGEATPPHPYKPLGILVGPIVPFCLSTKSWGQVFTFHLHAYGHLTCPIQASIEEVMHVQTSVVPRATPRPLMF